MLSDKCCKHLILYCLSSIVNTCFYPQTAVYSFTKKDWSRQRSLPISLLAVFPLTPMTDGSIQFLRQCNHAQEHRYYLTWKAGYQVIQWRYLHTDSKLLGIKSTLMKLGISMLFSSQTSIIYETQFQKKIKGNVSLYLMAPQLYKCIFYCWVWLCSASLLLVLMCSIRSCPSFSFCSPLFFLSLVYLILLCWWCCVCISTGTTLES